jgi:hypothetical protein
VAEEKVVKKKHKGEETETKWGKWIAPNGTMSMGKGFGFEFEIKTKEEWDRLAAIPVAERWEKRELKEEVTA